MEGTPIKTERKLGLSLARLPQGQSEFDPERAIPVTAQSRNGCSCAGLRTPVRGRSHTRQQPASATGQGTKSREVERRGCGWRYGDLSLRDVMMVGASHHGAGRRRMRSEE